MQANTQFPKFIFYLIFFPVFIYGQFTNTITWSDEFNYTGSPDSSKWTYDIGGGGWGNNELQYYTSRQENARVENGSLIINAKQENYGGNAYTSARLQSSGDGHFKYGKIEVRARFTGASGTWPAIWALPTDWVYGGWPDSGEIDLMEHVSTHGESVQASIHTRDFNHKNNTAVSGFIYEVDYWNWHTYGLEWYPDRLDVTLDGVRYFSYRNDGSGFGSWPFDQRFHLMLNVAVGGWGGTPNFTSETMEIDWVRAQDYTGEPDIYVHPNAWYRIVNRNSNKSLDIEGPSASDGTNIHQWTSIDQLSQQWKFIPSGSGSFRIISRHNNKAIDVTAASWENGANIQLYSQNGTHAQDWWLQQTDSGYYKIVSRETGKVLDISEYSTQNGGNLQQWSFTDSSNQEWRIEEVVPPPTPSNPTGLQTHLLRDQIAVHWNAVNNVQGYKVMRSDRPIGPFTEVAALLENPSFIDTDVEFGNPYYYKVIAISGSSQSPTSEPVTSFSGLDVLSINAGSSQGRRNQEFARDTISTSGSTSSWTGSNIDLSEIPGAAPVQVYEAERWGSNLIYDLPKLSPNKLYRVRLHFIENYWEASNQRRFNVYLNGELVDSNLDVYSKAGGKNKALIRSYDTRAKESGSILLQLTALQDNASIAGIEVMELPDLTVPKLSIESDATQVLLSWPAPENAFHLYHKSVMTNSDTWEAVPDEANIQDNRHRVQVPIDSLSEGYYRLSSP